MGRLADRERRNRRTRKVITVHQHMALNRIIGECHMRIIKAGAHARVVLRMPGSWGNRRTRRYSRNGPHGKICAQTHDGKKILVMFPAAELTTSLQEARDARITR